MKTLKLLLLVCLLMSIGCGPKLADDKALRVISGRLYCGMDEVWLRAIEVPNLIEAASSYPVLASALHCIAEVGGNAVCFNLPPSRNPLSADIIQKAQSIIHEATERRMIPICRIFEPEPDRSEINSSTVSPSQPLSPEELLKQRQEWVKSIADSLRSRPEMLYLLDGLDAGQLAKQMKKAAPELTVAAVEGGDVRMIPYFEPVPDKGPVLSIGGIPDPFQKYHHFILPATDTSYALMDRVMADPSETQPWTPDNSQLSEQEKNEGWISLFDGKTFDGWVILGDPAGWQVKNGEIQWVQHGGKVIRSRDRFENFILRLDWKIPAGGNSGVFIRAPREARASRIGLEIQIEGDYGEPPSLDSTGAIYVQVAPRVAAQKPNGEWNSYEIECNGSLLKVTLNGQVIQDLDLDQNPELALRLRRGFIGLQDHGGQVSFRNIRIKVL